MLLTDENRFDLDAVSKCLYRGETSGLHRQVIIKTHTRIYIYIYIYIYMFFVFLALQPFGCIFTAP